MAPSLHGLAHQRRASKRFLQVDSVRALACLFLPVVDDPERLDFVVLHGYDGIVNRLCLACDSIERVLVRRDLLLVFSPRDDKTRVVLEHDWHA